MTGSDSERGLSPRMLLTPFSFIYGAAIRARNAYYDRVSSASRTADVPVISVGNLTVGGTGKTPLVIEIVRRLRAAGRKPAILTRGYAAAPGETADEVLEYRLAVPDVPVVVNPDRVAGAATARREHDADCLVLDDGFQHRRLRRDLEIVVIDALDPWGGGRLLPAGRLREPLSSLRRADYVVITRTNQVEPAKLTNVVAGLQRLAPQIPLVKAAITPQHFVGHDGSVFAVAAAAERRCLPVCGLGNPQTFVQLVRRVSNRAADALVFADHHRYSAKDVAAIAAQARRCGAEWIVTTRKDWVKLGPLWTAAGRGVDLYRLDARLDLADPRGEFDARLRGVLEEQR